MDLTLEDLRHTQCVMNWDLDAIRQQARIDRLVRKFKEKLEEKDVGQTWKALNILLFLSYEDFVSEKRIFNSLYLQQGQDIIQYDLWVRKHYKAAQHVLHSSWAHIYLKMGTLKSALDCMSKVTPYNELSNEDKAFVLALKACLFMMYGPSGNEEASKILTEVLELDQNEPEWYHLKGKCLARMRRLHYRSKPTSEELAMLKKAVEMNEPCSRYLVHLGRSTADLASAVRHSRTSVKDFKVLAALETDVESLLRKAVKLSMKSPHVMCHIAKSFAKLSHYFRMRNEEMIHYCVRKAMETSPSDALVNHTVGLYHLSQGDVANAVFFLTEASNMGVHGATFDLCRLKWRECRGYNPVPDLMEVVENNDQFAASEAHCLLATYYFFEKDDLVSAVKHWKQWYHCRAKEEYLVSSCFLGQESFDFNSVLYDEIRLKLNSTRCYNHEDRVELEKAAEVIRENRPELQRKRPVRQRQDLLDKAQMVSRLGRTFPDSIAFMRREQRAKRKKEPFGLEQITNKKGKKMCVSSKYNAFARDRNKKGEDSKERTRSQSESRVFDRRNRQKPFWRPTPKRQASVESLNKGGLKTAGSGRVCPNIESDLLKVRAASVETLLLLKSYEKSCRKQDDRSRSGPRRGGSQESLTSNVSYSERRTISRTLSSEQVFRNSRQLSNDREGSFRACSPSGYSADQSSNRSRNSSLEVEPPRSWRRDGNTRPEQQAPRSSFFQSFVTIEASSRATSVSEADPFKPPYDSRPTSRSSIAGQADSTSSFFSRNYRGQGDRFGPPPRSSLGNRETPSASWSNRTRYDDRRHDDGQSRSGGRGNYVPRGGSFSRGGFTRGRGLAESKSDFENAFKRLNLR